MIDENTQQQLMDYLFEEMNPQEKKEFERKLHNSEELREKLKDLQTTQSVIGNYSPEEVKTPEQLFQNPSVKTSSPKNSTWTRTAIWTAAAVLLIAIFFGLLNTVQVGQTEQGYYLTFGNPPVEVVQDGISEEELNQIIAEIRTENALMFNSMIDQIQREQNAQFNESLTVLADYYEERRNRDLMLFTEGLLQLEENTATRINRTNQALNGIIYALSNE